jgi:hypothetical protein
MKVLESAGRETFVEMIAGIGAGARELAAAHAQQFSDEVATETDRAHSAVGFLVAGSTAIGIGMVFVLETLVAYLYEVRGWSAWSACLSVALFAIAIGVPIWLFGHWRLKSVNVIPRETLQSVGESLSCIANARR